LIYDDEWINDKTNLHSAIISNAEALGGKNVSHDAAKKVSIQSLFNRCQGVRVDDIVRQRVPNGRCSGPREHGWQKLFEFEERPASVRGLTQGRPPLDSHDATSPSSFSTSLSPSALPSLTGVR